MGDWRIGLAVTPKLRTHEFFNTIWVVRDVIKEADSLKEILKVELYIDHRSPVVLMEPADDWKTA